MKRQWKNVAAATSEVDSTFLVLRVISLIGGLFWLTVVPLSPQERALLFKALVYFSLYSTGCYLAIFLRPDRLRHIYLVSLFLDLIFLSNLVYSEATFENSFFLGYYLLVSLHTIYFGLRFGLLVASLAALFYLASISPLLHSITWTDLALRMAFLYFIAVPLGLLSEKTKRDKEIVEKLNKKLAVSLENVKLVQKKLIEEEKFSAIGRLTADIAHEIRNPLTAVGGFARRLDKSLTKDSKEKEYISIIVKEVSRLEKILADTLVFGKVSDLKLKRDDLSKPASAASSLYRQACKEQNITLVENFKSGLPKAQIACDQVQQALSNLISNSIDAMPEGGTLSITTDKQVINKTTYLSISVSDTGSGVSPEISEFIFDPFYSTKKIGLGTGLGLPIVRKILEEHRGRIRVKSLAGGGVAFTLYFPFQSEEKDKMVPCWEYLGCGIETDPSRRCRAYPYFGRTCWSTAGSDSEGKIVGICATKLETCQQCSFFKLVNNFLPAYVG